MGEVTRAEFEQLLKEVRETRLLAEVLLTNGLDRDEWPASRIQRWLDEEFDRRRSDRRFGETGIYGHGLSGEASYALMKAGMDTLEDVASRSRDEVATVPRVGPATISKFEKALEAHDLTWREAVAV